MTDPSGITPIAGQPSAQSGSKGQVVQIVSLPEGLQNNARAIRLQGEVVGQNDDGSVRVRTPQGDVDINMRGRQPQQGQQIEVDIPPGNPPKQATIRPAPVQAPPPTQQPAPPSTTTPPPQPLPTTPPAQGQPPPATGGTTQPSTLPPVTSRPAPTNPVQDTYVPSTPITKPAMPVQQPLPPLNAGQIVKLVPLVQPLPAGTTMPQGQVPDTPLNVIQPKTTLQTNIIAQKGEGNLITVLLNAVKSAIPQSIMPQGNIAQANPAANAPQAIPVIPQLQPVPSAFFQPVVLNAQVLSMTLPSGQLVTAPPSMIITPTTPAVITPVTVTITELTPQQQPVIPIPMNDKGTVQNFILQSPPASVPVGTQITLLPSAQTIAAQIMTDTPDIVTAMPPPATGMPIAPSPAQLPPAWRGLLPLMQPAAMWPVMDELFQTFYQATPQAAQILGRTIPSPANGANFGPAVLLFAAALKSGDLQTWLGDKKLDMIQKLGKGSVMARLSGETASLAGNNDAPATDWKSFPVPILWQNEISKIMFHVRREPSENEKENPEGGTRFVMDLSLTRMGEVQIDGLVRGKRLDLVIRTQLPISSSMQEAMATAYAKAIDGTDIYGEIGFQSDRTNWETILKGQDAIASA